MLIRASDLPGVLRGYYGRCVHRPTMTNAVVFDTSVRPDLATVDIVRDGRVTLQEADVRSVDLDTDRPEVRDRLIRWAAEGAACLACPHIPGLSHAGYASDVADGRGPDAPCAECDGSGYVREPQNLSWARDRPDALEYAVRRVAAGLPVLGVLGAWTHSQRHGWVRPGPGVELCVTSSGWCVLRGEDVVFYGRETGEAGKAAADAWALGAGHWLDGGPVLTVDETPGLTIDDGDHPAWRTR